MKSTCAGCSTVVTVDENNPKIPDGPFNVKCPKCGQPVRFPGKKAAQAAATQQQAPAPPAPDEPAEEMDPAAAAQASFKPIEPTGIKALVAMNDRNMSKAISKTLKNLGYTVEAMTDAHALRLLDTGNYEVVAMQRMVAEGPGLTCYQKLSYISADARRTFFLILIGDEYTTGDPTQAFIVNGDLVVHTNDAGACEVLVRDTLVERTRLFRIFIEAKKRADSAAGY